MLFYHSHWVFFLCSTLNCITVMNYSSIIGPRSFQSWHDHVLHNTSTSSSCFFLALFSMFVWVSGSERLRHRLFVYGCKQASLCLITQSKHPHRVTITRKPLIWGDSDPVYLVSHLANIDIGFWLFLSHAPQDSRSTNQFHGTRSRGPLWTCIVDVYLCVVRCWRISC